MPRKPRKVKITCAILTYLANDEAGIWITREPRISIAVKRCLSLRGTEADHVSFVLEFTAHCTLHFGRDRLSLRRVCRTKKWGNSWMCVCSPLQTYYENLRFAKLNCKLIMTSYLLIVVQLYQVAYWQKGIHGEFAFHWVTQAGTTEEQWILVLSWGLLCHDDGGVEPLGSSYSLTSG